MQPWQGNPRVTHLLPFPLLREYRQESSVHGSPLNGAHTHQSPARRQPLNNVPLQKIKGEAVERKRKPQGIKKRENGDPRSAPLADLPP